MVQRLFIDLIGITCLIVGVYTATTVQSTSKTPATSKMVTTPSTTTRPSTAPTTTPLTPAKLCQSRNASCDSCLADAQCLWCKTNNKCVPYPSGDILPKSSLCKLAEARWGVCWVNFEALIIAMGAIGGIIIISITVCICCCCCCKSNKNKYAKDDERWERKKRERQEKSTERRAERKARTDEIRRKYGLMKDDNAYQRFDNEA